MVSKYLSIGIVERLRETCSGRTARTAPWDAASRMKLQARRWLSSTLLGWNESESMLREDGIDNYLWVKLDNGHLVNCHFRYVFWNKTRVWGMGITIINSISLAKIVNS